jgi:hypothetical protein
MAGFIIIFVPKLKESVNCIQFFFRLQCVYTTWGLSEKHSFASTLQIMASYVLPEHVLSENHSFTSTLQIIDSYVHPEW